VADLEKQKNDLEAKLAKAAIDKQQAAQNLITAEGVKADALARKTAANAVVDTANAALVVAQKGLAEAQQLAAALPAIGIDFPHPNQWKPKELRIDVNGKEFGSYAINQRLKAGQSAWVKIIRPMSQENSLYEHCGRYRTVKVLTQQSTLQAQALFSRTLESQDGRTAPSRKLP
jgi:hypothetical protein